jgi:SAM-dependent methyltransferase
MSAESLTAFYRQNRFNPVHINVEEAAVWESHAAKRRNLYERHLGIPLAFLRGRAVVSFGCNSGENELILGGAGADLTLVEPNEQVHPRLRRLFHKFGLEGRVTALLHTDVEGFPVGQFYDLVSAEGFLHTVPHRDDLVLKLAHLVAPGGFAVISWNDRYGILLELTRRMILWRACQLAGVGDVLSDRCLDLARTLYGDDFARLNASRTFEAWWRDTLVNPFVGPDYLCTYPGLLAVVERAGCEFHSTSPRWALADHFGWYKNCDTAAVRHRRLLDDFRRMLPFFLTGSPPSGQDPGPAPGPVLEAVSRLVKEVSEFAQDPNASIERVSFPATLSTYLREGTGPHWQQFAGEIKGLYEAAQGRTLDNLLAAYARSERVRKLWGTPYHYLCFTRPAWGGASESSRLNLLDCGLGRATRFLAPEPCYSSATGG